MKFFRGVSLAKGGQLRILFLLAGILLVTLAIQAFMIKEGFEEMGDPLVRQPGEALTRQPGDPLTNNALVPTLTEQQKEQLARVRSLFEQQEQNKKDLKDLKQENELSISADERQDQAIEDIKNATFRMIPERKRRSRLDDAASSYNA
jgi:hypothetical protein